MLYTLDIDAGTITATIRSAEGDAEAGDRPGRPSGPTTSPSPATARGSMSPTGPAAPSWPSTRRPADRGQDRRRRAPEPDRRPPQGRPDLRRLRVEQQRLGDRHPTRHRDRDDRHGPVPARARREHARRPGRRPRRQDALRRQRRQQLRGRGRHRDARTAARSRGSSPPAGIRRPWPSRPTARPAGRRRQGEPDASRTRSTDATKDRET